MNDQSKPVIPKAYNGPKPQGIIPDIFIQDSFSKDDDRLWVPLSPGRWSRPLCFNISQGYWVHLTKVIHPAPVHGFVIKGSWRYLEHDWVAREGSYLFEPPGEIHTLVVDDDCDEMITLFHNSGALLYCDENGKTINSTDVFDRVKAAREHFVKVGLGEDYVNQFIR